MIASDKRLFFKDHLHWRLLFVLVAAYLCFSCNNQKSYIDITGPAMGSTYTIRLVPQRGVRIETQEVKTSVDSLLEVINQQMSTYVDNSEISLFNKLSKNSAIVI